MHQSLSQPLPTALGRSRANGAVYTAVAIVATCVALWLALLPSALNSVPWIYSWDSVAYIETANSIHAGRGLMQRVIDGIGPEIWQPISWWPPGYPILIAALQSFGLSAANSGVAIAAAAGLGSVVLIALICMRLLPWPVALATTSVIIAMPTFVQITLLCMSDSTYYLFVAASVFCIVRWTSSQSPGHWNLFFAGLFCGAAWSVRYSGAALIAATGIFLLMHLAWLRLRDVVACGLIWGFGVAVCAVPLLLRNYLVFGKGNPYSMRPSELGLWDNLRRTATVLVEDLTASETLVRVVSSATTHPLAWVIGGLASAFLLWRAAYGPVQPVVRSQRVLIFLAVYALLYTAMIVAARTQYRWGQLIDTRHLVQVYWIIWIIAAAGLTTLISRYVADRKAAANVAAVIMLVMLSLQVKADWKRWSSPAAYRWDSIEASVGRDATQFLREHVDANQIVLSTRAELLRLYGDINARKLPATSQYAFLPPVTLADIDRIGSNGLLWGVVIEDVEGGRRGEYDALAKDLVTRPDAFPQLKRVAHESPAMIFKYVRP